MVTAFIVDDEPKVCKLIQKLTDWDSLGIQLIGSASNGIDAYAQIAKDRPDIIITDICMPGYDGIELIHMVKKLNYKCFFVIISGHRDFEYAHSALKFGVDDYLLKPIKQKELHEVLRNVCEKLNKDNAYHEKQQRNIVAEQKKFVHAILADAPSAHISQMDHLFVLQPDDAIYQAVILKIDHDVHSLQNQEDEDVRSRQFELFQMFVQENYPCFFALPMDFGMLAVLAYENTQGAPDPLVYKSLLKYMCDRISPYNAYRATLGVGQPADSPDMLKQTILSAIRCIRHRIISGTDHLIYFSDLPLKVSSAPEAFNSFHVSNAVEVFNAQAIRALLSEAKAKLEKSPVQSADLYFQFAEQFFDTFVFTLKKNHSPAFDEASIKTKFHTLINDSFTVDSLFSGLETLIISSLRQCEMENAMQQKRPILIAQQYISTHYSQKLTLEEIAALVNFNPTYFSNMFKKETGTTLSDYITHCRIDAAKSLLKNSQDSISEVAVKTGFGDQKYFSKIFSRIVGLSPSKFRSLYA